MQGSKIGGGERLKLLEVSTKDDGWVGGVDLAGSARVRSVKQGPPSVTKSRGQVRPSSGVGTV